MPTWKIAQPGDRGVRTCRSRQQDNLRSERGGAGKGEKRGSGRGSGGRNSRLIGYEYPSGQEDRRLRVGGSWIWDRRVGKRAIGSLSCSARGCCALQTSVSLTPVLAGCRWEQAGEEDVLPGLQCVSLCGDIFQGCYTTSEEISKLRADGETREIEGREGLAPFEGDGSRKSENAQQSGVSSVAPVRNQEAWLLMLLSSKHRVLITFGEHAREFLPVESFFKLVNDLCSGLSEKNDEIVNILGVHDG
eukprot:763358-Hanusia_phi.AAC.2